MNLLPQETSSFLLDYVNLIADMTHQELRIACEHMRFPDEFCEKG